MTAGMENGIIESFCEAIVAPRWRITYSGSPELPNEKHPVSSPKRNPNYGWFNWKSGQLFLSTLKL